MKRAKAGKMKSININIGKRNFEFAEEFVGD
jgi:hypothetical protein